jgi:FAD synthase
MRCVPFGAVRQLSPEDFVSALVHDLRAAGVVVGLNYRFGFKASRPDGNRWLHSR